MDLESLSLLKCTCEIVAAAVSKRPMRADDVHELIRTVHAALVELFDTPQELSARRPAVSVRKSVTPNYIVCLEDGRRLKVLKRYLRTKYKLSPDAYRARWNLSCDYPMVAPHYAALRSKLAKQSGLGTRQGRSRNKRV